MSTLNEYIDEERFTLRHPKEICQVLNTLIKSKAILNLRFNHGLEHCATSIVGVNVEKNAVYLDLGLDTDFNSKLLASKHITISKDDGIVIQWVSHEISIIKLKDGEALKVNIPTKLLRLQRREFYRSATPVATPIICKLTYCTPSQKPESFEVTLVDISLGGIGTMASEHLPIELEVGTVFNQCKIAIPNADEIELSLEVRNVVSVKLQSGARKLRIGFAFVNLSKSAERIIQRYVLSLEREACLQQSSIHL